MAAGIASARERDERFRERRCGDGSGHVVGKRKKRVIESDAAGIASANERNERFHERRCGDGGGHVVGKRKKRVIPRAALWGWRRACRRQEK
jgi:hypothetical protein